MESMIRTMKLTTKGRYAVTAMLDLALHHHKRAVTLADIAGRQSISLSYLEQLFAKLRRNGLVESVRGPGGGYRLASPPEDISVARVVAAINGRRDTGDTILTSEERYPAQQLWRDLSGRIHEFLSGISLAELVSHRDVAQATAPQEEDHRRAQAH